MLCERCKKLEKEAEDLRDRQNMPESVLEEKENDIRILYELMDGCPVCRPLNKVSNDLFSVDLDELDAVDTAVCADIIKIEKVEPYFAYENADIIIKALQALHKSEH